MLKCVFCLGGISMTSAPPGGTSMNMTKETNLLDGLLNNSIGNTPSVTPSLNNSHPINSESLLNNIPVNNMFNTISTNGPTSPIDNLMIPTGPPQQNLSKWQIQKVMLEAVSKNWSCNLVVFIAFTSI